MEAYLDVVCLVPVPCGSNAISVNVTENEAVIILYAQSLYFDDGLEEVPTFLSLEEKK